MRSPWALLLLAIGFVVGGAVTLFGFVVSPERAFAAYLTAWLFWMTLALGVLLAVAGALAARVTWFVVLRRLAEIISVSLTALAVLFVPVIIGMQHLYPWMHGLAEEGEKLPEHLSGYLNQPFFIVRAAIYLLTWVVFAELLFAWSKRSDVEPSYTGFDRMRNVAAAALPAVGLTQTFASFDWVMSLAPRWISTAFGLYVFAGAFVAALSLLVIVTYAAERAGPLRDVVKGTHYHALGRLVFAFVVVWAYIAYAQFFLVWIADIPDKVTWYYLRLNDEWRHSSYILAICHFAIPFFVLLSRSLKHRGAFLAVVSAWVIVWHYFDMYWLVMPSLYPKGAGPHWTDVAAMVAVGCGVALFAALRGRKLPLVVVHDPRLVTSINYESR